MLKNQNIICFGSANWQYPGLQQTVMRLLSKNNRIIYVNALGTRKTKLRISELKFYVRRLLMFFEASGENSCNVKVLNPIFIPVIYSDLVRFINKFLMRIQIKKMLTSSGFNDYILWIGTPTASFLLDSFVPQLTVYNPVDRYYAFDFVQKEKILKYESEIAINSDVIICTSDAIREDLLRYNENTYTVTHGVDVAHFRSSSCGELPSDMENITGPIVGFFGGLSERVNYGLIEKIAQRYPRINLVLIGKELTDISRLKKYTNVHLLGHKDFSVLPNYLELFDVCMIPYVVNELMLGVDPVKLREYLALGKPVVSVDLPEVRKLESVVYVAETEEDFVVKVAEALEEDCDSRVVDRIRIAEQSDWEMKINEIEDIVLKAFVVKLESENQA